MHNICKNALNIFPGYKIQTWTEESGAEKFREIIMKSDTTSSLVQSFIPNSLNYARVLAFNGAFNGPASNTIKFHTPEGKPGPIGKISNKVFLHSRDGAVVNVDIWVVILRFFIGPK